MQGRRTIAGATVVVVALILVSWLCWGGGDQRAMALDTDEPPQMLRLMGGSDWYHALDVIAAVNTTHPTAPLVLLLGGSAARECTVSDTSWARQVDPYGQLPVVTYNIGSRNQTFYEDLAFVRALPKVPTIVFIGVNLGRFTSPPTTKTVPLTPDPTRSAVYAQHHYSQDHILSTAQKRAQIKDWLKRRYPVFRARFSYNLRQLETILHLCTHHRPWLHPVMLDLPRDLPVVGDSLHSPVRRYHQACRALADEYGVPSVNFVTLARFVNTDFFDIFHTVEPGRVKFQTLLAAKTALLMDRYGMLPAPTPSPSPSGDPSPTASGGPGVAPSASPSS